MSIVMTIKDKTLKCFQMLTASVAAFECKWKITPNVSILFYSILSFNATVTYISAVQTKQQDQEICTECVKISWTELHERTLIQRAGMRASYMQSRASRRFSLIMMVPSMASLRSVKVFRTSKMTRCIRSISWRRKMFMGWRGPIFFSRSLTCWEVKCEKKDWNGDGNDADSRQWRCRRKRKNLQIWSTWGSN